MTRDPEKIALAMELRDCGYRWADIREMTGIAQIHHWVHVAKTMGLACCKRPSHCYPDSVTDAAYAMRNKGMRWKQIASLVGVDNAWNIRDAVCRRFGTGKC